MLSKKGRIVVDRILNFGGMVGGVCVMGVGCIFGDCLSCMLLRGGCGFWEC